jgi:hypothetical protein
MVPKVRIRLKVTCDEGRIGLPTDGERTCAPKPVTPDDHGLIAGSRKRRSGPADECSAGRRGRPDGDPFPWTMLDRIRRIRRLRPPIGIEPFGQRIWPPVMTPIVIMPVIINRWRTSDQEAGMGTSPGWRTRPRGAVDARVSE